MTERLGERLGVKAGDEILAEVREGERPKRTVVVAGLVNDMIGMSAYMDARALARLMREDERASLAAVAIDPNRAEELYGRLKGIGRVATVTEKVAALRSFEDTTASFILVFTAILTTFAVVIAVGVVYNTARIALQERAWELASLRVLGFTRGEVSRILLTEIGVQLVAALPPGMWLGYQAARGLARLHETEMFRIPVVVEPVDVRLERHRRPRRWRGERADRSPAYRSTGPRERPEDSGIGAMKTWARRGLFAADRGGGRLAGAARIDASAGSGRRGARSGAARSRRSSRRTAARASATATSSRRRSPADSSASRCERETGSRRARSSRSSSRSPRRSSMRARRAS